jgi:hypothetical protein
MQIFGQNFIKIKDSALNNNASALGQFRGSGAYTVTTPPVACVQCIHYNRVGICDNLETKTCSTEIMSANYSWQIDNIKFHISPAGIGYTADLVASYGPLQFTKSISGNGNIQIFGFRLIVEFPELDVPLTFNIPTVGKKIIYTVSIPQPFRTSFPIPYGKFVGQSGGTTRVINAKILEPTYELSDGEITFRSGTAIW